MRAPLSSLLIAGFAPRPIAAAAAIAALTALGAAQAQVQPPASAASAPADAKTDANTDAKTDAKARDADQTLDRVEITGTRASLQRSLNLKRSASGVQDSISATELGRPTVMGSIAPGKITVSRTARIGSSSNSAGVISRFSTGNSSASAMGNFSLP